VNFKGISEHPLFRPVVGAILAVFCGLALWKMPLGESWEYASYDYLFRFGARPVTNKVVLVLMDSTAYDATGQMRTQFWSRALHAQLLNKLADDGCPLAVFDVHFQSEGKAEVDEALAGAMRRHGNVVLMADVDDPKSPRLIADHVKLPHELFLRAQAKWGIANAGVGQLETPRRHWPFPSPGAFPSLPWAAAQQAGARLSETPQEQWLRFYGENGAWSTFSYDLALSTAPGYFREKIVFIGNEPENVDPRHWENDKFRTPYTRWTGEAVGGVKIMATTFLNLINHEWLRRPPARIEFLALLFSGATLGAGLYLVRPRVGWAVSLASGFTAMISAVLTSYYGNTWFPWLTISGGQVPCALAWALITRKMFRKADIPATTVVSEEVSVPVPTESTTHTSSVVIHLPNSPETPDYELFEPPFGEGAYGKVWLARNAIGQWQALKAVYLAKFNQDAGPYDREFRGIKRYKPVSDKHPGLLRVDFVSRKKREGYFYYVMELGDSRKPGWESNPATYKPRDLASVRAGTEGRRLPVQDCLRIGLALAEALEFLHRQGLTHRDIKPQNIIFVNGGPKLADVGLVAEIRPTESESTWVGTPGYMPPPPEPPGTVQADIYALGMVLYVISTGRDPAFFPEISTTLVDRTTGDNFIRLNEVIVRACQPDCTQRYASATELRGALEETGKALGCPGTAERA
jgi:CHASE2 domain-containing sensor protein